MPARVCVMLCVCVCVCVCVHDFECVGYTVIRINMLIRVVNVYIHVSSYIYTCMFEASAYEVHTSAYHMTTNFGREFILVDWRL